ncbi:MAG: hypothetical protein ACTSRI_02970 [Promethearchaeota archaeon]
MKPIKCLLTEANIQNNSDPTKIFFNISTSKLKGSREWPYLLIIKSTTEHFIKITLYPIKKEKILKISLSGINMADDIFIYISKTFKNYDIIHTSGLCIDTEKNQLLYECYLNLNLSEKRSELLKNSLNKIRNMFKDVIIEEIALDKNEVKKS